MSAEATFWAWKQDVKSTHKLALLALANCHNGASGRCDPSIIYIANTTGLNRKTVQKALVDLEKLGFISRQSGRGMSNFYTLKTDDLTSTKNGPSPVLGQALKRDLSRPKNGTLVGPKTGHESKRNLKENLKHSAEGKICFDPKKIRFPEALNISAWVEWCSARSARRKPITELAAKKQISKLILHPPDVQQEIVDWSIQNDYQGLFEPRGNSSAAGKHSKRSAVDQVNDAISQRAQDREEAFPDGGRTFDEFGNFVEEA